MKTVHIEQRREVIHNYYGTSERAAVVVPIFPDQHGQWQVLLSTRSKINGYNGKPMSHAGTVLLFGGASNPGETLEQAALREFMEETSPYDSDGKTHNDFFTGKPNRVLADKKAPNLHNMHVITELGQWLVEEGVDVTGFLIVVPNLGDIATLGFDPREVDEVFSIPARHFFETPFERRNRKLLCRGKGQAPFAANFESPHLDYPDEKNNTLREIWGAAGYMIEKMVAYYQADWQKFSTAMRDIC